MFNRSYFHIVEEHFRKNKQMLLLMGPRQVGKTTLSLELKKTGSDFYYLNWDNLDDRELLLKGPKAVAEYLEIFKLREKPPIVVFDEIHKYREWKIFLKGFYDTYAHNGEIRIVVTGSARLDTYFSGGDSLMGRYLRYRIHPITVGELVVRKRGERLIADPYEVDERQYQNLYLYGGFPEPLLKKDSSFHKQWLQLRNQQLFFEDVRDLSRVHELKQMQLLGHLLSRRVGSLTNFTALSKEARVSIETVRRWVSLLESLYYLFLVPPWSKNIPRSLLKEPKLYLWDWSTIEDKGKKAENFIALHLLKSCQYWTDRGYGNFALFFLRDKEKKEVDFIVCHDDKPWFLVEVKSTMGPINPALAYFQKKTAAKHAFQVVLDGAFEKVNCFACTEPVSVSARAFLSQLV